jgi:hypothetical protein
MAPRSAVPRRPSLPETAARQPAQEATTPVPKGATPVTAAASFFWDGPVWPPEPTAPGAPDSLDVTLPPAPISVCGRNLAEWLNPVCQSLAEAAAKRLGPPIAKPVAARAPVSPPPVRSAEAWSPLPAASFRSMDWSALSAYCQQHVPDPADEAAGRRFVLSIRNAHALPTVEGLQDALKRWQRVISMDLMAKDDRTKAEARRKLAGLREWQQVLARVDQNA